MFGVASSNLRMKHMVHLFRWFSLQTVILLLIYHVNHEFNLPITDGDFPWRHVKLPQDTTRIFINRTTAIKRNDIDTNLYDI